MIVQWLRKLYAAACILCGIITAVGISLTCWKKLLLNSLGNLYVTCGQILKHVSDKHYLLAIRIFNKFNLKAMCFQSFAKK